MTNNQIPVTYITGQPQRVASDDPYLFLLDQSKITLIDPLQEAKSLKTAFLNSQILPEEAYKYIGTVADDIIDLSDIYDVRLVQYRDPITKLPKYRLTLKITNSSTKPQDVKGVDVGLNYPTSA